MQTVLFIDDSKNVIDTLKKYLSENPIPGITPVFVHNDHGSWDEPYPISALVERIRSGEQPVDMIVTDKGMSTSALFYEANKKWAMFQGGLEMALLGAEKGVPVVIHTGSDWEELQEAEMIWKEVAPEGAPDLQFIGKRGGVNIGGIVAAIKKHISISE